MANGSSGFTRKLVAIVLAIAVLTALAMGALGTSCVPSSNSASGSQATSSASSTQTSQTAYATNFKFRSKKLMNEHFNKHGKAMGYASAEDYVAGANAVVSNPDALHKQQKEDGDDVYYLESTDEIVIVSTDGYIRTYFNPGGIGYYNRQ